jgi:hypothetical protein
MSAHRRAPIAAGLLAAVLAVGAVTLALASPGSSNAKAPAPHLLVKGSVTNLWPGRTTTMRVTVKNPFSSTVVVKTIKVKVGTGKGLLGVCSPKVLTIKPWKGKAKAGTVKAHRTKRFVLKVSMKRTAPNSCQGVRFPLAFSAKAVG